MIGIISGTAFSLNGEKIPVDTPYGHVEILRIKLGGTPVYFIQRHGKDMNVPPHLVNYRANIWALRAAKVEGIISICAVGSLKRDIRPGEYVVIDDFIDFTNRSSTFFEDKKVHTDLSTPYNPEIRKTLLKACKKIGVKVYDSGIYVCTEGPRFETKAEIKMLSKFGDVVGMTGVPEVVLANELKIPYAGLCLVTNYACGVGAAFDEKMIEELCDGKSKEIMRIIEYACEVHD